MASLFRIWEERGMQTFAYWCRHYNDLDVSPGLEAMEIMKAFYTRKGIDIFKDAVSTPGVSMHYVLSGAIDQRAGFGAPRKGSLLHANRSGEGWAELGVHEVSRGLRYKNQKSSGYRAQNV